MLFRHLFLISVLVAAAPGVSPADGLLDGVVSNSVLQALGSPVTSQAKNFTPTVPLTTSNAGLPPPPTPAPVSGTIPYDPFQAAPPAAPQMAAPVIHQGIPQPPPAGYTGGTVCQNGICQLAPVQTPAVQAPPQAAVIPRYPPGFTGSTFGPPTSAPPQGVNVEVAPVGRSSDLSKVREGVLNVLPPKP